PRDPHRPAGTFDRGLPGGGCCALITCTTGPVPRVDPGNRILGGAAARGPEEINGDGLREPSFQTSQLALDLAVRLGPLLTRRQGFEEPAGGRRDLAVGRLPGGAGE